MQTITSAETSLKQVPAIFRLINQTMGDEFWSPVRDVLDMGGGKYDLLTDRLAKIGVRSHVLDPYNRSWEHNLSVEVWLTDFVRGADIALCSNVLNVIRETEARNDVHRTIKRLTKPYGTVFFTVYEGDKSSRGRKTSKGWQWNRPTKNYVRELKRHYHNVTVCSNKLIVCEGFK